MCKISITLGQEELSDEKDNKETTGIKNIISKIATIIKFIQMKMKN